MAWGFQKGLGRDFNGFLVEAFFMAAMYLFWSSVMNASKDDPPEKIINWDVLIKNPNWFEGRVSLRGFPFRFFFFSLNALC